MYSNGHFLKNVFKDTIATLIMRHQIDLHDFFREKLSLKPNWDCKRAHTLTRY